MSPYWKCQIAGWSLYGLMGAAIPTLYGGLRGVVVGRALVGSFLGLVLTDGLRRHMRRNGWLRLPLRRLAPRVAAASLLLGAAIFLSLVPFLIFIFRGPHLAGPMTAVFAGHTAVVLGWCLLFVGYHSFERVRRAEAEKWRLQLAMRETELGALRAQLNPHFLFNSLNSLRALVAENPVRAQEAITGLAALLRHSLQASQRKTTTLARELEATERYLELEALRFESRLRYQIEIDPRALEDPVPPMMVQTLAENAVKHGISRLPDGGEVRIEVRKPSAGLHVRVTNTGRLEKASRRGIGLASSLERLRLQFGEGVTIELDQSGSDEVTCEVRVPPAESELTPEAVAAGIER